MKIYTNPPVPNGYKHICGEWNNGFVIERKSDGSQFVWIPVGSIPVEMLNENMRKQEHESVKKYGGFYISRFNISQDSKGKPQSIQGELPWVMISLSEARIVAKSMEQSKSIESHLTYDEEYHCVLQWLIISHAASFRELYVDSSNLGNYWNSKKATKQLAKTGSCEEWCLNNIYDFAGNVCEWVEFHKIAAFRGGAFCNHGSCATASFRGGYCSIYYYDDDIGFRIVLYIK